MKTMRVVIVALLALLVGCGEEGGNKGFLRLAITDAPADSDEINAVNLVITNVEARKGDAWKSIKIFSQPVVINLLDMTGSRSFELVNQIIEPGTYSKVRIGLRFFSAQGGLVVNPHSSVSFTNGSQQPLTLAEGAAAELVLDIPLGIGAGGRADYTLDVDVRKSLTRTDDRYEFRPVVRAVESQRTGLIEGTVINQTVDKILVLAYASGNYTASENAGGLFPNAITSGRAKRGEFALGFLPAGTYELVFVSLSADGTSATLLGKKAATVTALATTSLEVDVANGLEP